jgi:hypothetical protein
VTQPAGICGRVRNALIASLLALGTSGATAATFSGIDVSVVGSATTPDANTLQLTSAANYLAGAAWANSAVSTAEAFSSNFDFTITTSDARPMADGLAFVIQATGTNALGDEGGGIGFRGLDAVGFVVHTWANNHLGFSLDGDPSSAPASLIDLGNASLIKGSVVVGYNPSSTLLFLTGILTVDGVDHDLSEMETVDLAGRFGSTVHLGFTAGTGSSYAVHTIDYWTIAPIPEPDTYALLFAGLGLVGWKLRRRAV